MKTMIFAKLAFSIKVRKLFYFAFVFAGRNEENPFKNRIQKRVVLKHRIWRFFPWILGAFWSPKIIKNRKYAKKMIFEGVLFSTIALELLFGWIFSPSEIDFEWFLSLQNFFFKSRIAFGETCVKRFRLKNLLWWLGRRGADQWIHGSMDPWICCSSCCENSC